MENPRIEKILLRDIGPFRQTEIVFGAKAKVELANVHILTGPNGCGKTTALDALAQIFRPLNVFGPIRERFRSQQTQISFVFSGNAGIYGLFPPGSDKSVSHYGDTNNWMEHSDQRFFGSDQELLYYKTQAGNLDSKPLPLAAFVYSGLRSLNVPPLRSIEPIRSHPLDHALEFQQAPSDDSFQQWVANNRAQSAVAYQDGDLDSVARYNATIGRITTFVGDVCGLSVEFRLKRDPLDVVLSVNGELVPLNLLPDGMKSILTWVGDLVRRLDAIRWEQPGDALAQPIFLFLDEIDIHLHPRWQRLILPALQKLLPQAEIFVSTHSPFVVGSVDDAWVYSLPEPDGPTVVHPEASGAGKSYSAIVKEVFGVEEEFDPETELLFDQFYAARNDAVQSRQLDNLRAVAERLEQRGEEARAIVARELRQVSRRVGQA